MKIEPLIYVSNLSNSIRFYTEILEFRKGDLYPDDKNPTYAPIFIDGYKLMLATARNKNNKFHPGGIGGSGVQFFIQVDNVDEIYERIKDRVKILDKIETKSWGDREFTIKDPDDYLISFYVPTA